MGAVLNGRDPDLGRDLAVKVRLHPKLGERPSGLGPRSSRRCDLGDDEALEMEC
jgi:hypothetical protein